MRLWPRSSPLLRAGLAPACAFLLALASLLPQALAVAPVPDEFVLSSDGDQAGWSTEGPPYGWSPDEDEYGRSAYYFGSRLARLDRSTGGGSDPGWSPDSYWALTQPMGTRLIYAIALGITGLSTPPLGPAWQQVGPGLWRTDRTKVLTPTTRRVLRLAAVVCAAAGLALVAWRLSWWGVAAAALFLALPYVRRDLALAWAEGPLLFGLGLTIAAYGRRWFGGALGLAATFKLTAVGLWPLALLPGATGRGRHPALRGLPLALGVWTLLEPPSWLAGGPAYLIPMLGNRVVNQAAQNASFGLYLPARYIWPAELLLLVGLAAFARWLQAQRRFGRLPAIATGTAAGGTWRFTHR